MKSRWRSSKTYKVILPKGIPESNFWSFTLYDNMTRSMLDTPQRYPRAGSQTYPSPAAEANADGSMTVYFSPTQPLYTRLAIEYAGKPLRFPSLVERREDMAELFESFLREETKRIGGAPEDGTKLVDAEVKSRLTEYEWPGNVAEMQGVARAVARNSKDFVEVIARHLPTLGGGPIRRADFSAGGTALSTRDHAQPSERTYDLSDVERILRNAEVPQSPSELDGRLASLQECYGELVKRILEVTLVQRKIANRGKNFITPALRSLFPNEITAAYQAYRKLLSLSKLFKTPPASGSLLEYALQKARDNGGRAKETGDL